MAFVKFLGQKHFFSSGNASLSEGKGQEKEKDEEEKRKSGRFCYEASKVNQFLAKTCKFLTQFFNLDHLRDVQVPVRGGRLQTMFGGGKGGGVQRLLLRPAAGIGVGFEIEMFSII